MKIFGTDISMIRGDTEFIRVSVQKPSGEKVPLVDGDRIFFTIKVSSLEDGKLLQKIVKDFEDGDALIRIDSEDTKHLDFGQYFYDIQLSRPNGDVKTIVPPSKFTIEGEITYE